MSVNEYRGRRSLLRKAHKASGLRSFSISKPSKSKVFSLTNDTWLLLGHSGVTFASRFLVSPTWAHRRFVTCSCDIQHIAICPENVYSCCLWLVPAVKFLLLDRIFHNQIDSTLPSCINFHGPLHFSRHHCLFCRSSREKVCSTGCMALSFNSIFLSTCCVFSWVGSAHQDIVKVYWNICQSRKTVLNDFLANPTNHPTGLQNSWSENDVYPQCLVRRHNSAM